MRTPRLIVVIVLAGLAFVAVGFLGFIAITAFVFPSPWSNDPGQALAARIRAANSPLVQSVEFRSLTMIDPPEVHVIVRRGVTEAQAEQLWCDVVAPAGGSQLEGNLGALIYDDEGNWLASDVTC
jgi:hypothetical protein